MGSCEISSVCFSVCLFAPEFFSKACDMQQFSDFLQEVRVSFNLKSDLVRFFQKKKKKMFSKKAPRWLRNKVFQVSWKMDAQNFSGLLQNYISKKAYKKILFWSFCAKMVPKLTLNFKKLMISKNLQRISYKDFKGFTVA